MDKFFNSLEYIDIDMACHWLGQLIEFFRCTTEYLWSCARVIRHLFTSTALRSKGPLRREFGSGFATQQVIGVELCQVDSPVCAYETLKPHKIGGINVTGMAGWRFQIRKVQEANARFLLDTDRTKRADHSVRSDDIKRLASSPQS